MPFVASPRARAIGRLGVRDGSLVDDDPRAAMPLLASPRARAIGRLGGGGRLRSPTALPSRDAVVGITRAEYAKNGIAWGGRLSARRLTPLRQSRCGRPVFARTSTILRLTLDRTPPSRI
jgi:hypothetical protein